MEQYNSIVLKAISGKYTKKIPAKTPHFPRDILKIQLVIPPTANRFISINPKGAQAFLDHLFEKTTLKFKITYTIYPGDLIYISAENAS